MLVFSLVRPGIVILYQCGAAIFQRCPNSALFRLPAFADSDVRAWMSGTFPSALAVANASAGDSVNLQRLQNTIL